MARPVSHVVDLVRCSGAVADGVALGYVPTAGNGELAEGRGAFRATQAADIAGYWRRFRGIAGQLFAADCHLPGALIALCVEIGVAISGNVAKNE